MELIPQTTYKSLKDNPALKRQAELMYYSGGFLPTEICERLCVDIEELGKYVFGGDRSGTSTHCWRYKKDHGEAPKFLEVYEATKPMYIKKTEKKLLDIVNEIVDAIGADREKILDMDSKDLSNFISSLEKIDKMGRLEEGKATSHVVNERETFSLRDIIGKSRVIRDVDDNS